ncbi:hypothetical protein SCATT_51140 [Streptantibioticus cattleyicolor NRRL 8057 = DSM 46488]|uniref:Uncharacterized protein n=1 Tax=Streptantibioticus cattleyicolor (strain ATCC 35852 / DSM 46488 / JCM 4925 / NBRC 14057 / NRRL 8057) TaxID=1003195 RepID=G8WVG1_STREN|nr:hypothetical protein SCATT_51140 [Streptantibioticus cattleyicolor NRRL 8057 = DSM 46488]
MEVATNVPGAVAVRDGVKLQKDRQAGGPQDPEKVSASARLHHGALRQAPRRGSQEASRFQRCPHRPVIPGPTRKFARLLVT